ncbi:uncharacterized protein LOC144485972 isoform X9 [Mustelus asterias]
MRRDPPQPSVQSVSKVRFSETLTYLMQEQDTDLYKKTQSFIFKDTPSTNYSCCCSVLLLLFQSDFLHLDRTHLYQDLDSRIEQELDWESEFLLLLFLLLLELGFTYSESDKDGIKTDTRSIKMKHLMMSL